MIAQVVEVPSATAIEKPLEANLAKAPMETKVLPTVLPKVVLMPSNIRKLFVFLPAEFIILQSPIPYLFSIALHVS